MGVIFISFCQDLSCVLYDLPIMGVNIVVILAVILMVGRRYKQRV